MKHRVIKWIEINVSDCKRYVSILVYISQVQNYSYSRDCDIIDVIKQFYLKPLYTDTNYINYDMKYVTSEPYVCPILSTSLYTKGIKGNLQK